MACITMGGGPSDEQKRAWLSYQEGAQVPGYRGYIPQRKYRVGQTYGDETASLSKEFNMKLTRIEGMQPEGPPGIPLPRGTGDNRYTEKMVPGYTGYVPRSRYIHGETYKHTCDEAIAEFLGNREKHWAKFADLRWQLSAHPRLTPVAWDPYVRDQLNLFRDTHPLQPIMMDDHRGLYEPPIPGYTGFIPRIGPTSYGLAKRYTAGAQSCLDEFSKEQYVQRGPHDTMPTSQDNRIHLANKKFYSLNGIPTELDPQADLETSHVIYRKCGIIPKYDGYVPQNPFEFGNTYSEMTRRIVDKVRKYPKETTESTTTYVFNTKYPSANASSS